MINENPEAANESGASSAVRVLIVEDNPGDVRLLTEMLRGSQTSFEVASADRVESALARLAQRDVDVVLSDLTLPDGQGIETFRRLHESAPEVPVIVLTDRDDEALAMETVKAGAQDYLVKRRVDRHLLVRTIRYAMKRAEAERALAEERTLLRGVINNLLDSIYVKDVLGRYRLDNIAHQRALGAGSMEEVVGKTAFDFFPHDTAVHFQADDQMIMRTGRAIVNRQEAVVDEHGSKSWLSTTKVPLLNGEGEIIGLVGIGRDITERKRVEEQLAVYNEELRAKNIEMEDDLDMASEIQQAFLPQQFPRFPPDAEPEASALRFFSKYLPTGAVGGDFFHVLPISDTEAGVFICDVMGHGVRAALVTAIQRALIEELSGVARDPGEFLTRINHALLSILRRIRTPMFASAFYLFVDTAKGEMRFANAGHPKPLHLRRKARETKLLGAADIRPGSALGVFENAHYQTQTAQAEEGDLIVLFTDGLFEVEGENDEYFDQHRLIAEVDRRIDSPPERLFDDLIEKMQQFSVSHTFIDDVCIVGVQIERFTAPMSES